MVKRLTAPALSTRKVEHGAAPIVMVTAADYPSARMIGETDADMILVGDSLAMVVLGYSDTLSVTIDVMAHHTAAVARANPKQLIVGDLPWMSYHVSIEDTLRNAAKLVRAGAGCDGQVLVLHDLLGMQDDFVPKFVRQYANLKAESIASISAYVADVRSGAFPDDSESYHIGGDEVEALGLYGG